MLHNIQETINSLLVLVNRSQTSTKYKLVENNNRHFKLLDNSSEEKQKINYSKIINFKNKIKTFQEQNKALKRQVEIHIHVKQELAKINYFSL